MTEIIDNQFEAEDSNDNSPRKLAIITRIKSINPISGADRIVAVTFTANGWTCVAGKSEYNVGDSCVFWEIDSFLKKDERYDKILGKCLKVMKGQEGYRLRSQKFKGQISQGFSMPLSAFPELDQNAEDGTDVTEQLGVKLWQLPVAGGFGFNIGRPKGGFPHFIKKTDQTRIQSLSKREILDLFSRTFECTEKLDGTSCTIFCRRREEPTYGNGLYPCVPDVSYDFGACSRNLELKPLGKETVDYTRWVGGENEPLKINELLVLDEQGNIERSECGEYLKVKGTKEIEVNSVYWDMVRKYHVEERSTRPL